MSALKLSKVVFDEIEHTYTIGNKQLSGVTALLKRQLFPDKYDGISDAVLKAAAERGNAIHRQIELFESFGGEDYDDEVNEYIRLKSKNNFVTLATEWLVSDNKNVASSIDVVFSKELKYLSEKSWLSELYLCDIKTTSRLDVEYLSWQLSIYKYLLLLDNPKAKVAGLIACWLHKPMYGKPKMVVVPEKPLEWVKDLIECDARGEQWVCPEIPVVQVEQDLAVAQEITSAIANMLKAEEAAKTMKESLKELMIENGVKKWECDDFVATIVPGGVRKSFDYKTFQADHPALYEQYQRESEYSASLKLKSR